VLGVQPRDRLDRVLDVRGQDRVSAGIEASPLLSVIANER